MESNSNLFNVGIIGTGKIGTDLLMKIQRSPFLHCSMFSGRNSQSSGIKKSLELGVQTSTNSIDAFTPETCDLVFDASSAKNHRRHWPYFKKLGLYVVDLTPAKIGQFCVPSVNLDLVEKSRNINMVTCGGQAAIPIAHILTSAIRGINEIEISSVLSNDSIGAATWENIDDYYATTASAITEFTGIEKVHVALEADASGKRPHMLTTIRVHFRKATTEGLSELIKQRIRQVQKYAPGYSLASVPKLHESCIEIQISVRGQGDWIPEHAGNLDIINCAAISVAEQYAINTLAKRLKVEGEQSSIRRILTKTFGFGMGKRKYDRPAA